MFYILFKILSVLLIMFAIAMFTLLERKTMGITQNRISVNKNTLYGILQPIIDGLKLAMKTVELNSISMKSITMVTPITMMIVMFELWELMNMDYSDSFLLMNLFCICLLSMTIYSPFMFSISCMSKYSFYSSMRMMTISICVEIILTTFMYIITNSNNSIFSFLSSMSANFPLLMIWLLIIMMDTMRASFDMAESESELVSGFNIEFASIMFIFMFLSEYSMMILFSVMTSLLFSSMKLVMTTLLLMVFIFVRCVFVRLKIDNIVSLSWMKILPMIIFMLILTF